MNGERKKVGGGWYKEEAFHREEGVGLGGFELAPAADRPPTSQPPPSHIHKDYIPPNLLFSTQPHHHPKTGWLVRRAERELFMPLFFFCNQEKVPGRRPTHHTN